MNAGAREPQGTPRTSTTRKGAIVASTVAGLAVLAAVALTAVSLALFGVPVPGPPRFPGSDGPAAFLVIGIVYSGLALLFAISAFGLFTRRHWAWTLAMATNVLALLLTMMRPIAARHLTPDVIPFLALTVIGLLILISRPGRAALRPAVVAR